MSQIHLIISTMSNTCVYFQGSQLSSFFSNKTGYPVHNPAFIIGGKEKL